MSTPRVPLPFTEPFTLTDLTAAGLTHAHLLGWLQRHEAVKIGRGVYARADLPDMRTARAIHINRLITDGRDPVSYEGAAFLHRICRPPQLPPRHKVPQRTRDVCPDSLLRMGKLLVPTRTLTVFENARWQRLPGALIPLECFLRNGFTKPELTELRAHIDRTDGWAGTANLRAAMRHASRLSGSALESQSRGLMLEAGLPIPEQQVEFVVDGYRYLVDFFWRELGIIGEADGEMKFDERGRAQFALHRRQARLQSLGLTVVRWGWPELFPNPTTWLNGMRQILR